MDIEDNDMMFNMDELCLSNDTKMIERFDMNILNDIKHEIQKLSNKHCSDNKKLYNSPINIDVKLNNNKLNNNELTENVLNTSIIQSVDTMSTSSTSNSLKSTKSTKSNMTLSPAGEKISFSLSTQYQSPNRIVGFHIK
jgi:6-pyruvoyl-tetrahydropterin synthase